MLGAVRCNLGANRVETMETMDSIDAHYAFFSLYNLQLTGFQPSFHVLLKTEWTIKQCNGFADQINKRIFEHFNGN